MKPTLDLWCGTKSATKAFEEYGSEVISVDIDPSWEPTYCVDILDCEPLIARHAPYGFGWGSPNCKFHSIANSQNWSKHWDKDKNPISKEVLEMEKRVRFTLYLLNKYCENFVLENPRGMLRTRPFMLRYFRQTVTYCQYGDTRMKPTDLWGRFPLGWEAKSCRQGASCHVAAPRGSATKGSSNWMSWKQRIMVPYGLSKSLADAYYGHKRIPTLEDFL